jgi:hypothetical protein
MRVFGWLCLALGLACLVAAGMLGIRAMHQAAEISAYQHARACPAGAPPTADCLQAVDGSVAAVTELPGNYRISAIWALDVRTASTTPLHLTFSSDSPMLGYAVDGDPAVVTMWRGVPVSVVTNGRWEATASVPQAAFRSDLGNSAKTCFVGAILVLWAWASRRNRRAREEAGTALRTRRHPASRARALGARAVAFLPVLLTVAVLFGILVTSLDGPPARAFRHAPACVGETNLATCVGDFTAAVNGVRTQTNGGNSADVLFVTPDGAIRTWAVVDGDSATIARLAGADEAAGTQLRIRVWRRSVVGAELGGSWYWAQGDPAGDGLPTAFLAVSFAMLLLVVRLRIHRQTDPGADSQELIADDLGQVAAAAGSVVLLAYGFWPGAFLAVAVLLWLALTARRTMQRGSPSLAALHSS